jgi:hypothetical protein
VLALGQARARMLEWAQFLAVEEERWRLEEAQLQQLVERWPAGKPALQVVEEEQC